MSLQQDLLRQARHLATKEPRRPSQASLRRAVSAAYYALFHLLVDEAVGRMVVASGSSLRDCLRRAFAHGNMKTVAKMFAKNDVSPKLRPGLSGQQLQPKLIKVAEAFVDLQQARHDADYNMAQRFSRRDVLDLINQADRAVVDWRDVRNTDAADTFLVGLLAFGNMRS